MFGTLFSVVFIQPTLNLLMGLAFLIPGHDLGLAIIGLTILVKLALYPLTKQQIKQQRAMQAIQPKIEEIRARLKDNKEARKAAGKIIFNAISQLKLFDEISIKAD